MSVWCDMWGEWGECNVVGVYGVWCECLVCDANVICECVVFVV